jgi:hypothetical protein
MFGTIRKHQTWLWVIIIIVVVIAFVIYFNPSTRQGQGGPMRSENFGTIAGETITRDKFADANREVYLMFFTRYGDWPDKEAQRTGFNEVARRFYGVLLKKAGIEHPCSDHVVGSGREICGFEKRARAPFAEIGAANLAPRGMQRKDSSVRPHRGRHSGTGSLIGGIGRLSRRKRRAKPTPEMRVSTKCVCCPPRIICRRSPFPGQCAIFHQPDAALFAAERVQVSVVASAPIISPRRARALSATNLNEIVEANLRVWVPLRRIAPTLDGPDEDCEQIIHHDALNKARRRLMILHRPVRSEPLQPESACPAHARIAVQLWRRLIASGAEIWTWPEFCASRFQLSADTPFSIRWWKRTRCTSGVGPRVPSEVPPFERCGTGSPPTGL